MNLPLQCRAIVLLLAVTLLAACGGGATSSGIGTPGGGGPGQNANANLAGLALECETTEVSCGNIHLVVPPELAGALPPPPGFIPGARNPETEELLSDYSSVQSARVGAVTLTPRAANAGATIRINGVVVASEASSPVLLDTGDNEIVIVVTAANGVSTRTYTITVTRLSLDVADLSSLSLSNGTLNPAFARDETEYTSIFPFALQGGVRVTAVSVEPAARIEINGQLLASGVQSDPIALAIGVNPPIEIKVTALNNAEKIYRVTATQLGSANLTGLTVAGLTEVIDEPPVAMTLTPVFSTAVPAYSSRAENRVIEVIVTATAAAPGAVIRIGEFELESGVASAPIPLVNIGEGAENLNALSIVVTHEVSGDDEEPFERTYTLNVTRQEPPLFEPEAYLKPSQLGPGFGFGASLTLSADGNIAAIGAPGAVGGSGQVNVFVRAGDDWIEQATLPSPVANAGFGHAVALSADGAYLVVGAPDEPGIQGEEEVPGYGAVYLYARDNGAWQPPIRLSAFNPGEDDRFGASVALAGSAGTLTVAVGAPLESSGEGGVHNAPVVPEDHDDNAANGSGAVYVYTCPASGEPPCGLQAFIKIEAPRNSFQNQGVSERFGESVALSATGDALAVGVPGDSINASGVNGEPSVSLPNMLASGAVYLYTRDAATWGDEPVFFKAQLPRASYLLGTSVALSADGATLAAGTPGDAGSGLGIGPPENLQPLALNRGAVHVFVHETDGEEDGWTHQIYIKPSNTRNNFRFGAGVALSGDGNWMIVGAPGENSLATTVDGNELITGADLSGAAYVFRRQVDVWSQAAFVKTANSRAGIQFGAGVAMSADAALIAGGAPTEGNAEAGVTMALPYPPASNGAPNRGAVYLFRADDLPGDDDPLPGD